MHEVTLSASGRRHGAHKKQDASKARSRLCPAAVLERFCQLASSCEAAARAKWGGACLPAGRRGGSAGAPEDGAQRAVGEAAGAGASALTQAAAKQRFGAGYQAAWAALQQPGSMFAAWLPKPGGLRQFTAAGGAGMGGEGL